MAASIWAHKNGERESSWFDGTVAGRDLAYAYCTGGGMVTLFPGTEGVPTGSPPAGVAVFRAGSVGLSLAGDGALVGPKLLEDTGIVRAIDYATFQAALDAVPAGGTLLLPPGEWTESTAPAFTGMTTYASNVRIKGAGSTSLRLLGSGYANTDMLKLGGGGYVLEDFALYGPGVSGSGRGVAVVDQNAVGGTVNITNNRFRRLTIHGTASWGIEFDSSHGGMPWNNSMTECVVYDAKSGGSLHYGAQGVAVVGPHCYRCEFNGPGFGTYGSGAMDRGCVHLDNATWAKFDGCSIQPVTFSPAVSIQAGKNVVISNIHFETGAASDSGKYIITTSGIIGGLHLRDWSIYRPDNTVAPRLLKSDVASSNLWVTIENVVAECNGVPSGGNDIVLGNSGDRLLMFNCTNRNRSTGTNYEWSYTDNHGVSVLHGQWPYPRLSLPRVNGTGSITPRKGDVVYDYSTDTVKVYNGAAWKTLTWT